MLRDSHCDFLWQHHMVVSHLRKAWGHKIRVSQSRGLDYSLLGSGERFCPVTPVHHGDVKCGWRHLEQGLPCSRLQMDLGLGLRMC